MDYQKIAEYFLPALLALVYTLAAKYASGAIGALLEKVVELLINAKMKVNENKVLAFTKFDDYIFDKISSVVLAVKDSYVDNIKAASADGKLTEAEAKEVTEKAIEMFKASLTKDELKNLQEVVGDDIKAYLASKIPQVYSQVKSVMKDDVPAVPQA